MATPPTPKDVPLNEILEELNEAFNSGKGLVPLAGAGISATAGIPTTPELTTYLKLCVSMALGLDEKTIRHGGRWHPKLNSWPTMRGDWQRRAEEGYTKICELVEAGNQIDRDPGQRTDKAQRIFNGYPRIRFAIQQAHGVLSDWRLALQFLSRLLLPDLGSAEAVHS